MTRDMTEKQFKAALARNGFQLNLLWMQDISGQTNTHYGVIADQQGHIYLRESLARAIQDRAKEVRHIKQAGQLAEQGIDAKTIAAKLKISDHTARLYISKSKTKEQPQ